MRVTLAPRVCRVLVAVLAFASCFSLGVGITRAETTQCTPITAIPMTISSPGVYCLTSDLSANVPSPGNAITIEANSVVVDLNGHRIANLGGPNTASTGIFAEERQNITIRNGSIRGFFAGIMMLGGNNAGH